MSMDGRKPKIIVADSDRTVLELLQIRLEVAGYQPFVARSGQVVLDSVRTVRPAAMILDANIEGDGFDLLLRVRQRYAGAPFPILATGRDLKADDIRRALGAGAQSCLIKPFSGAEAVERIARLLQAQTRPPPVPNRLLNTVYI